MKWIPRCLCALILVWVCNFCLRAQDMINSTGIGCTNTNVLLENSGNVKNYGLAGVNTFIILNNLKYNYKSGYDYLYSSTTNRYYNIAGICENMTRDSSGNTYESGSYIIYLSGDVRSSFSANLEIKIAKGFKNAGVVENVGLAGNNTFVVLNSLNLSYEPPYDYLFSDKLQQQNNIIDAYANTTRDSSGNHSETGSYLIYLPGDVRSGYPIGATINLGTYVENSGKVENYGLAGVNTFVVLNSLKYNYKPGYDYLYSSATNRYYNIAGINENLTRNSSGNSYERGSYLIYLSGDVRDGFSENLEIKIAKGFKNAGLVKGVGLADDKTFVVLDNLTLSYIPPYGFLFSDLTQQYYNILEINKDTSRVSSGNYYESGSYLIFLQGDVRSDFKVGYTINLASEFENLGSIKGINFDGNDTYMILNDLQYDFASDYNIVVSNANFKCYDIIDIAKNQNLTGIEMGSYLVHLKGDVTSYFASGEQIKLGIKNNQIIVYDRIVLSDKNIRIPIGSSLRFEESGCIEFANNYTFRINNSIYADLRTVFAVGGDAGDILPKIDGVPFCVIPQWWGVKTKSSDNTFVNFANRVINDGWNIVIPAGEYFVEPALVYDPLKKVYVDVGSIAVRNKNNITISGQVSKQGGSSTNWPTWLHPSVQDKALKPTCYHSTFALDNCSNVRLKNIRIEAKGEFWGFVDSVNAPNVYGSERAEWAISSGGHAIFIAESSNICLENITARLAGSCGVIYMSSCDNIFLRNCFSNANSKGFAAYAVDNWTNANINSNGTYNFLYCNSWGELLYESLAPISGKAGVCAEGDAGKVLNINIEGGVFKDAVSVASSFPEGGNGVYVNSTNLKMNNVTIQDCEIAVGVKGKSAADGYNIDITNSSMLNNKVCGVFIHTANNGVNKINLDKSIITAWSNPYSILNGANYMPNFYRDPIATFPSGIVLTNYYWDPSPENKAQIQAGAPTFVINGKMITSKLATDDPTKVFNDNQITPGQFVINDCRDYSYLNSPAKP
ncbi:hypothetical protein [Geothrix sp. 21YS21S-4]|uniref:hypothetical protein n=1 Tax=Geothrix sp. 21YS21S-4 TaxID=3068889 RepID=UPI0027BA8596|nr:hypothetical protein [Geothrix sp. 21YS21S-4]